MKKSNEYLRKLVRTVCIGGVSTLTLGALSAPSYAADASGAKAQNSDELEEIVVTGIRASLQKSLDIKKEAVGVVDAISSEDIGKFPDSNIAASMARVPGVTVSRGSPISWTSSGDATSITVRGFGPNFNTTLSNGRELASAAGGRGFDYTSMGSDFVSSIQVMKTPDATLSSGAIGATVNIINRLPFDKPGLQAVGSLSGTYATGEGKTTPNVSALFSDTFADDTFGVLVDFARSETKTQGNHINIQGWEGTHLNCSQFKNAGDCKDDGNGKNMNASWFIQDYGIYQEHNDDKRTSGRLALQWRPIENLLFTADYDYSKDNFSQTQWGYSIWFNGGSLTNVTTNADGSVSDFVQNGTPTDFQAAWNGRVIQNNDVGLNVKWDATENTSYMLDFSNSVSELNPNGELSSLDMDVGYGPSAAGGLYGTNVGIAGISSDSVPYPNSYGPNGDKSKFINNGLIGSHVMPLTANRNKDTINEFKLQGTWKDDKLQLDYGVHYLTNSEKQSSMDDFQNNQWQTFAGYGPASNNYANGSVTVGYVDANGNPLDATGAPVTTVAGNSQYTWTVNGNPAHNASGSALPQDMFTNSFSTGSGFIHGYSNGNMLPAQILAADGFAVRDYLQSLGNPYANGGSASNPTVAGFNYGNACQGSSTVKDGPCVPAANSAGPVSTYDGTYAMAPSVGAYRVIDEHTLAFFVSAKQKTQLGSMPLTINVGVREERTTMTSQGLGRQPTGLQVQATDHTAFLVSYTPTQVVTETNKYNYLLPNLDLNLNVTDNLKLRLDASRTLTRPLLGDISPVLNVGQGQRVGALNASGGNPKLLPYTSDNMDLGAEWYYARNSYLAIDGFIKNITNFVTTGIHNQPINNVVDPTTGQLGVFAVQAKLNNEALSVSGLELGWQHTFGDSGFGVQANATFVSTDTPYNPNDLTQGGNTVTGLGNSWNLVAFYDKYGFQIRLAADHQNEVLSQFGQQQNNSAYNPEPVFTNANTYLDMSTSYDFNSHFSVFLTGNNLTNEVFSTHGRFSDQVLNLVDSGRRFTVGVHVKL